MSLESITNQAHAETKKKGLLGKVAKALFHGGVAVAAGALSYGLVGLSGPMTGIAFGIGNVLLNAIGRRDQKQQGLEGVIKNFTIGALSGIVGVAGYEAAASLFPTPGLERAAFGYAVANPTFTAAYMGADYIVKNNYNPIGVVDHFRQNYMNTLKEITLWLGLPVAFTINGMGLPWSVGGYSFAGYPSILFADIGYKVVASLAENRNKPAVVPSYA